MESSSPVPRVLPISSRFREPRMSRTPPKDREPFWYTRDRASAVSCCMASISARFSSGVRFRQSSFPIEEEANPSKSSVILLYSKVFNAF